MPSLYVSVGGIPEPSPLLDVFGCARQGGLRRDRCWPVSGHHPESGSVSIPVVQLFEKSKPMGKVHTIPWHRKPLNSPFPRSVLKGEQFRLRPFQSPCGRKKAGKD